MTTDNNCNLTKLALVNFKNYEQADFDFCPKINCLVGNNGTGKTNVLDAIYYLSMTKSSLNSADTQNIRYDADFFVIQGEYMRKGAPENLYCGIKRGQKKIFRRNRKDYDRMSEHIGLFPAVTVSPADSNLITGRSEERRRFINEIISQYNRQYLHDMMQYNHALIQRNALLKTFARDRTFNREILDLWTEQLAITGNRIYKCRSEFCLEIIPVFQTIYNEISGTNEKVMLVYNSQLRDGDFYTLLNEAIEKDRHLQFTTVGIHRDDLSMQINNFTIRKHGSQGQQKTFLVALKLANFGFIKQYCNITPVLLLDDIFDKFDASRVANIIRIVSDERFGQIFITDTAREHIETILKDTNCTYKLFYLN